MKTMKVVQPETVRMQVESLRGPQGGPGAQGERGERGPQGERGERGFTGPQGERGLQGLPGERGERGAAGERGPAGEDGFSPEISVERVDGGVLVSVKNREGGQAVQVHDGRDGADGSELFIVRYDKETKLADRTQAEIRAAVAAKRPCIALDSLGCVYSYVGEEPYFKDKNVLVPTFRYAMDYDEAGGVSFSEMQILQNGEMFLWGNSKVKAPNPKRLEFTGAVSARYDGSEQVTVNIPAGGGSGGGLPEGGEPNTMLVTDGDGNAKWEARTHWKEEGLIDVLPENTPMYSEDAGSFMIAEQFVQKPVVGNTYTVIWNGVAYECTAEMVNVGEMEIICLGDKSSLGYDIVSEEPFCMAIFPDDVPADVTGGFSAMVVASDGSTEATVRIQYDGVAYHKLDPGYLPIPMVDVLSDYLKETTLPVDLEEGICSISEPFAKPLAIGETYTVTWNGTKYTCTAWAYSEGGEGLLPALGNGAALDEIFPASDDPFFMIYVPNELLENFGAHGMVIPLDGSEAVTLSIQGAVGVKIDNSALDIDWIPKKQKAGETIVGRTTLLYSPAYLTNIGEDIFERIGSASNYIAFVDGVYYRTGVIRPSDNFTIIGNPRIWSMDETVPDTGEPFVFILSDEGFMVMLENETPGGVHEVALYHEGNAQTLPIGVPRGLMPDMTPLIFSIGDVLEQTVAEIEAAFRPGRAVDVRDGNDYIPAFEFYVQRIKFRTFRNGEEVVITYDEGSAVNQRWSIERTRYAPVS